MKDLPDGWEWALLGDVVNKGRTDQQLIKGKLSSRPFEGAVPAYSATGQDVWCADAGNMGPGIVLSAVGARCGKAFLADGKWTAIANTHAFVPELGMSTRFLWYLMNDETFWEKGGTAQPFVKVKATLERLIAIPPSAEQERIVAGIEEHLSLLDVGFTALVRIQQNLKRMRAAALSRLLCAEDGTDFPQVMLGDVLINGRYGTSTKCSVTGKGLPVLRIPNVQSGKIDLLDLKYATDLSIDLEPSRVAEGDILIIRTNGSRSLIGRAAVARQVPYPLAFASYLIRLKFDPASVNPSYIVSALAAPRMRARIEELAATSAGQYNISLSKLRSLRIPLPSLAQQSWALSSAETLLSAADDIDREAKRSAMRVHQLRSAILARAFAGGLVPQDPADEPASMLLQQIKAGRESSNGRIARRTRTSRVAREELTA